MKEERSLLLAEMLYLPRTPYYNLSVHELTHFTAPYQN